MHDPFLLVFGVTLKLFKYKSSIIVYDRHEYFEEMRGIGKFCERFLQNFVDGVVLVTNSQIHSTRRQMADVHHYVIVPNYPVSDQTSNGIITRKIADIIDAKRIHFVYIGSLSTKVDRDIDGILNICSALLDKYPQVHVTIGGSSSDTDLIEKFDSLTGKYSGRFLYAGYLNRDEVVQYTSKAHFGFLLLNPQSQYWAPRSPNKIFDYLMYGVIPVIRADIDGHENLQDRCMIFGRYDPDSAIISAIGNLIDDRKKLQEYLTNVFISRHQYSFESVGDRYLELYRLLIPPHSNT